MKHPYTTDTINASLVLVKVICGVCGQEYKFIAQSDGLERWTQGELIQSALPQLSCGQRELLISNTCDSCFDKLFPPEGS